MKKIFTLIAAALMAVSANAKQTIDLSNWSSWGDGITFDAATKTLDVTTAWSGGQFTVDVDASQGKYVMVKFTDCPISVNITYKGWWGSSFSVANSALEGAEYNFTEITEADWAPGQYHIQQVQFQGRAVGKIVIDEVAVISQEEYDAIISGAGIDPTAIWSGENDFGSSWAWDQSLGFGGNTFSDVKSGESLVFEFTPYDKDRVLQLELGQWGSYGVFSYYDVIDNSDHCLNIKDETSCEIPLTDDDITTLKSNGLRVKGYHLILTKIKHITSTFSPTAVSAVKAAATSNGACYNLAGQRVNSNAKGVVIMNGKKYIK